MMKRIVLAFGVLFAGALLAVASVSAQEGVDVTFEALSDSGVTGTGTVAPGAAEGETDVSVSLAGLEADSSHVNHIHEGSCDSLGGIVVTLNNVEADENGDGTGETTVTETDEGSAVAFSDIANGGHVIAVHAGETLDEDPTPITCGAIPAAEEAEETPADEATPTEEVSAPPDAGTGDLAAGGTGSLGLAIVGLAAAGLTALGIGGFALRAARQR